MSTQKAPLTPSHWIVELTVLRPEDLPKEKYHHANKTVRVVAECMEDAMTKVRAVHLVDRFISIRHMGKLDIL